MATTVAEVMTRAPATVRPDETLAEAARTMRETEAGDVLVVDDGELVGILTDRDIVIRIVAESRDTSTAKVHEACSAELETVTPDTSIDDAAELMRLRAVRRLPVVEGTQPVGIISLGDLAITRDEESVLGQVSAMPSNR
ncbi:CBS domain-containing protein [Parafrankia irregularis]|uniref:CBS domain-containing protein n=1 Tax=Parafrankia irregularis TaxID=795642 RepID=A0A0S4QW41_9ACTN|nr:MULTISPECIES: CBS domain-containing protein [Parafrankia]MBE3202572.1 CBS domain-containing protein [Parafrankia sp. CH37]CUU59829.1 CBS domain-containing protein [Parafrankia irregularis]